MLGCLLCGALGLPAQDPLVAGGQALERGDYPRAEELYRQYLVELLRVRGEG